MQGRWNVSEGSFERENGGNETRRNSRKSQKRRHFVELSLSTYLVKMIKRLYAKFSILRKKKKHPPRETVTV